MSLFLTHLEIAELTGYQIAHYQLCWLKNHGYPHERTSGGKPRVLRAYVEQRLGLSSKDQLTQTKPDFSHWQQRKEK